VAILRVSAQFLDKGIAIHFWHQNIGDDQGWISLFNHLQTFEAVMGADYIITFESQSHLKQFEDVQDIFNNENWALSHVLILLLLAGYDLTF
jgi:hypothetical protein